MVIHPFVLAEGPRMFEYVRRDLPLQLVSSRVFDGGVAIIRYGSDD